MTIINETLRHVIQSMPLFTCQEGEILLISLNVTDL